MTSLQGNYIFPPNPSAGLLVNINNPQDGDILEFNSTYGLFHNIQPSAIETNVSHTSDMVGSGIPMDLLGLSYTPVIPGTYTNSTVTVDQKGRIQSAANGTLPLSDGITLTGDGASGNAFRSKVTKTLFMRTVIVSSLPSAASWQGYTANTFKSGYVAADMDSSLSAYSAGTLNILQPGDYEFEAHLHWPATATGVRGIQWFVNNYGSGEAYYITELAPTAGTTEGSWQNIKGTVRIPAASFTAVESSWGLYQNSGATMTNVEVTIAVRYLGVD